MSAIYFSKAKRSSSFNYFSDSYRHSFRKAFLLRNGIIRPFAFSFRPVTALLFETRPFFWATFVLYHGARGVIQTSKEKRIKKLVARLPKTKQIQKKPMWVVARFKKPGCSVSNPKGPYAFFPFFKRYQQRWFCTNSFFLTKRPGLTFRIISQNHIRMSGSQLQKVSLFRYLEYQNAIQLQTAIRLHSRKVGGLFFSSQRLVTELLLLFFVIRGQRKKTEFFSKLRFWIQDRLRSRLNVQGVQIILSGRFPGRGKAEIRKFRVGRTPFQDNQQKLDFSQGTFRTFRGLLNIRIWVLYRQL